MVPNADAEPWGPHQLLSMAARLIQRRQDQALADLGLTHAAVIALQGLTAGPLNQEHLAAEIKVRSQSLGRVLSRLESAGLVTRTSSSRDRRSNVVAITDAGLNALAAAREVEKDALPPNLADGAVLSRELARVISYFPGSHRGRSGKEKTEGAALAGDRPTGSEDPGATPPTDGDRPTDGDSPTGAEDPGATAPTDGDRPTGTEDPGGTPPTDGDRPTGPEDPGGTPTTGGDGATGAAEEPADRTPGTPD